MVQSHAYVLHNTQALFLVLINVAYGIKPIRAEYNGTALVITGCAMLLLDPAATRTDSPEWSLMAYAVVFFTTIFGALYFILSSRNVHTVPALILCWLMGIYIMVF
jgi:drug/metabolite transporter (DMT)-like permease